MPARNARGAGVRSSSVATSDVDASATITSGGDPQALIAAQSTGMPGRSHGGFVSSVSQSRNGSGADDDSVGAGALMSMCMSMCIAPPPVIDAMTCGARASDATRSAIAGVAQPLRLASRNGCRTRLRDNRAVVRRSFTKNQSQRCKRPRPIVTDRPSRGKGRSGVSLSTSADSS